MINRLDGNDAGGMEHVMQCQERAYVVLVCASGCPAASELLRLKGDSSPKPVDNEPRDELGKVDRQEVGRILNHDELCVGVADSGERTVAEARDASRSAVARNVESREGDVPIWVAILGS